MMKSKEDIQAAVYLRTSKPNSKRTTAEEKEAYKVICKERNYTVYDYYDDGYCDDSVNRPEYQRLLSDIKNNKVNFIIFKYVDVISEDSKTLKDFGNLLVEHDYDVAMIVPNIKGHHCLSTTSRGFLSMVTERPMKLGETKKCWGGMKIKC